MAGYPGGVDLGLTDELGAKLSLRWLGLGLIGGSKFAAELAVKDANVWWSAIMLDRSQLLKLAATIIVGLSPIREDFYVVIRAVEAAINDCASDVKEMSQP